MKIVKVKVGDRVVGEQTIVPSEYDFLETQIMAIIYGNITIVRYPHVVDIYVYGTEYLLDSEQYCRMSDASIRNAIASILINFVEIEDV